ncbi:hypothetical protein SDC9_101537 [bioreactor metagenome]|uniref:Uncharacterized protein n=1 Tax=bioreactor metagenome TaxID=1076179 RepID=A0A645ANY9_9ZZZZ
MYIPEDQWKERKQNCSQRAPVERPKLCIRLLKLNRAIDQKNKSKQRKEDTRIFNDHEQSQYGQARKTERKEAIPFGKHYADGRQRQRGEQKIHQ